ncbi:MAG TPA: hypothetical protein VG892_07590 [Terriglobales bacterium]|nr:hypothetical protein [Terriglobales bacterium]
MRGDGAWATPAGSGTVTSVGTADGLTGGPITGSGTISSTEALGNSGAVITGTTYTIDLTASTGDLGKELIFTGSSGSAWSLGAGAAGEGFDIINKGTADITVTATGNVDGASTLVIPPGLSANFIGTGSTWWAGFRSPIASSTQFGVMKPDNSTITCTAGVCSSSGGSSYALNSYKSGNWYTTNMSGGLSTAAAAFTNTIYFAPFYVSASKTIKTLGTYVKTAGSGEHVDMAIYADSSGPTGTALANCDTPPSIASTGNVSCTINSSGTVTLAAGVYWFAENGDQSSGRMMTAGTTTSAQAVYMAGADSQSDLTSGTAWGGGRYKASTYGTWPDMTGQAVSYLGAGNDRIPVGQFQLN